MSRGCRINVKLLRNVGVINTAKLLMIQAGYITVTVYTDEEEALHYKKLPVIVFVCIHQRLQMFCLGAGEER
jgi:hypothetical protein